MAEVWFMQFLWKKCKGTFESHKSEAKNSLKYGNNFHLRLNDILTIHNMSSVLFPLL